jgi:hypothetical protein
MTRNSERKTAQTQLFNKLLGNCDCFGWVGGALGGALYAGVFESEARTTLAVAARVKAAGFAFRGPIGLQVVNVSITARCVLPGSVWSGALQTINNLQLAVDTAGAGSGVGLARCLRFGLSL